MYPYFREEQKFDCRKVRSGKETPNVCRQPPGSLSAGIKRKEEVRIMKGYTVESGYMGYVNGEYMLFASETDYVDYVEN